VRRADPLVFERERLDELFVFDRLDDPREPVRLLPELFERERLLELFAFERLPELFAFDRLLELFVLERLEVLLVFDLLVDRFAVLRLAVVFVLRRELPLDEVVFLFELLLRFACVRFLATLTSFGCCGPDRAYACPDAIA
jgi:hypothetical protein